MELDESSLRARLDSAELFLLNRFRFELLRFNFQGGKIELFRIKGPVSRDFDSYFFLNQKLLPESLMNTLNGLAKYFDFKKIQSENFDSDLKKINRRNSTNINNYLRLLRTR